MEYLQLLPTWLLPRWPQTAREYLVAGSLTLATVGLSAFLYMKTFYDYLWDDFIIMRRMIPYQKKLTEMNKKRGGAVYDPAQQLEKQAETLPNKKFLLFEDQKYTFSQTNRRANEFARTLQKLGVTREQRLAVFMRNKPELLFVQFACNKLAVPLSFLNTNLRTKSLMHCIKEGNTMNLLVDDDPELIEAVNEIHSQIEDEGIRVFVYGSSDKYTSFTDSMVGAQNTNLDPAIRKDIVKHDIVAYIFTSGTTGLPKACRLTYERWQRLSALLHMFRVTSEDILYAPLPFYHTSSLCVFGTFSLFAGTTLAFAPKFSASKFWTDCDKHNVTVIQYIGETCRYLLNRPSEETDKKHKIKLAIGNGLRKDIWQEFKDRFNIPTIGEFYGMTEGNVAFVNVRNKFGSCGRKSPKPLIAWNKVLFVEYDSERDEIVRDGNGLCKVVPLGKPGLLVSEITDLTPFDGYTSRSQTERKVVRNVLTNGDAYFNSGDMLKWDTDYYIYFVDRVGDTFRWKGENVATLEVGNLLNDLDLLQDSAVYGVPIPGMDGRCGMAALVLKAGTTLTPEVLKSIYEHCEQFLPAYARPVFIRFMSELYVTGTYKHQKFKLQEDGFDCNKVSDVYVHDLKLGTYVPLTLDVYESILNGGMKV